MGKREHKQAARDQRVCAVTGRGGAYHPHHAVRESDARRRGANPHDPRNALRVQPRVHWDHHGGVIRIPLACLTDENIEYAFEVLGVYAADYLDGRYAGEDQRVTRRLQTLEMRADGESR